MPANQSTQTLAREAYGKLPLSFEANQGQTDSQVKFVSRGSGYSLFLSPTEAVFSLSWHSAREDRESLRPQEKILNERSITRTSVVRMKLLGANPASQIEGLDELPGKSNYLIGNDPAKWRTDIPSYAKVKHTDVYPGVEMIYYGDQKQLEYDFVVAPGANPRDIKLAFSGMQRMRIDARGDLLLQTAGGEIRQQKPVVYQETGGAREYVAGGYLFKGRHEVGFEIGKYDASRPLVIDPVLIYSTYLGGTGDDFGHGIAVDDFGNVYIVGETTSLDFPTKNPLQPQRGFTNAFITKLNASGSALLYSTYLGGSSHDRAYAVAVDQLGSACITGTVSSPDFPTRNAIQPALGLSINGGVDAFIAKLNPAGSDLVFSTYLGRDGFESGYGITTDSSRNIYVTGSTGPGLPTTEQAFQSNFVCCHNKAFITKFDPTGTHILYSTYVGNAAGATGFGIAVDASQNAYITGYAGPSLDLATSNALQPNFGGGATDAFVAKIPTTTSASALTRETFDNENGGVVASPYANFSNWNVTNGQVNLVPGRNSGAGLSVNLDGYPPQGAAIETKTPLTLGSKTYRLRFDVAILGSASNLTVRLGNAFNETFTAASLPPFFNQYSLSIVRDIQISSPTNAKLSFEHASGTGQGLYLDNISVFEKSAQEYVTFLGGSGDENPNRSFLSGIKVDAAGNAYVTSSTTSPDFPRVNAIQLALAGGHDAFIAKLNPTGSALVYSTYLGGSRDDFAFDLAIDLSGNAFVVGHTTSSDFPLKNAIQPTFEAEAQIYGDGFVTKLSATGSEMVYSTYLGGNGLDVAEGVAIDSAGNAFVTGFTNSSNFPLANPLQPARVGGQFEAFVSKLPSVLGTGVINVFDVVPKVGGNTGQIIMRVIGENFDAQPLSVRLRGNGLTDLVSSRVSVDGPSTISSTFDLRGAAPGLRDVEVVFASNTVRRLNGAFTVQSGGTAQVWVDIVGRDVIRRNIPQTYTIAYGNRGNVNIYDVLLFVRIPKGTVFSIRGLVLPTIIPPPELNLGAGVQLNSEILIPIWFYVLPAKFVGSISLDIRPTTDAVEGFIKTELLVPPLSEFSRTGDFSFRSHHLDLLALELARAMVNVVLGPGSRQNLATGKGQAKSAFPADNCGGIEDRDLLVFCTQARIREAFRNGTLQSEKLVDPYGYGAGLTLNMLALAAWAAAPVGGVSIPFAITISAIATAWDIYGLAAAGQALERVVNERNILVVTSFDPNEKIGSLGRGQSHYLSGEEPLRYIVFFENAATATAPAQEVTITDQLDPTLVDLNSLNFGPISFGSRRITPSGADFTTDVDLRPDKSLIVRVSGKLDSVSGRLTWKFISLDPATGLPTTDPLAGFLPPSVNPPDGDGTVFFTVSPKSSLPTGTVTNNSASIVFDNNAAIVTPTWSNTIDNSKPASHVLALPATQNSATFNVQWSGTDTGSGIGDYTIYVSDNGGAFTPWLTQTTATQATYTSAANHTYSFFSVARDLTGNTEALKTTGEATTRILAVANIAGKVNDPYGNGVGDVRMTLSGDRSATAQTDESGASSFANLPSGSYTITPAKTNHSFSPPNRTFGSLSTNQTADFIARVTSGAPILISEETSTRALALDSVLWLREPFQLNSPIPWGVDRRTRAMLFIMNFDFQAGEDSSIVRADAEDASHRLYPMTVEYVGRTPGSFWLNSVVIRLNDDMGDLGDVLIRVSVRGVPSNRVRLGIGHKGGGPPDDLGAVPTPGRRP